MSKIQTEEKSPLLYVEDRYEDANKPKKKIYFENHHRLKDISSGATAVFTHFPDYIGTCWITTALCGLIFFMLMLLLLSTVNSNTLRVPRCIADDELNNKTIHLVHTYEQDHWKPKEIEIIDKIMKTYQDYKIHLILIHREFPRFATFPPLPSIISASDTKESKPDTTTTVRAVKPKNLFKKRKRRNTDYRTNFNVEAKRLLDMLIHGKFMDKNYTEKLYVSEKLTTTQRTTTTAEKPVTTIDDLLRSYPNIIVENTTFNHVFFNSPLYGYWLGMKEELRIFAIRVLQLWQYGGISFDLQPSTESIARVSIKNHTNITQKNIDTIYDAKILKFVIAGKDKYESLPDSVVAADDEGLHMESKVPCHAFFGQILMNLRRASEDTTVQEILQNSVAVFCKHYAAEKKYCDRLLEKKS